MRTTDQIRLDINNTPGHLRLILVRAKAARTFIARSTELVVGQLAADKGGEDMTNPENNITAIIAYADSQHGHRLAALHAIADALEADPTFAEAKEKLDPLHAELREAEAAEEAARREHLEATNALAAAEQEAKAKALASLGDDPAVAKARKALEKFQPKEPAEPKKSKADLSDVRRLGQPLETAIAD